MTIVTTCVCPPIPDRSHDWHAHFDWQCADDLSCEGYGETEESAVIDLLSNALEVDMDGSEQEAVLDLAIKGWESTQSLRSFEVDRECRREIEGRKDG